LIATGWNQSQHLRRRRLDTPELPRLHRLGVESPQAANKSLPVAERDFPLVAAVPAFGNQSSKI
jgi:hypothetical protein